MSQKLEWLRSKHLLRVTLKGDQSREEILSLDAQVYAALESEPACEAVIFDITQAANVAPHVHQSRMKKGVPPNHKLKYVCIVGEHRLLRLMLLLGYSPSRTSIQLFSTLAHALTFLRIQPDEIEANLPFQPPVTPRTGIGA